MIETSYQVSSSRQPGLLLRYIHIFLQPVSLAYFCVISIESYPGGACLQSAGFIQYLKSFRVPAYFTELSTNGLIVKVYQQFCLRLRTSCLILCMSESYRHCITKTEYGGGGRGHATYEYIPPKYCTFM